MFSGCDEEHDDREYTIEYRPGAHSSGENYSQTKQAGEPVMLRDVTYVRSGFTQTGWSTAENGANLDFSLNETYWDDRNITLYPFWWEDDAGSGSNEFTHNLPANVRMEYETKDGTGLTNAKVAAIKISDTYFASSVAAIFPDWTVQMYFAPDDKSTWTKYTRLIVLPLIGAWELRNHGNNVRNVHKDIFGFMVDDENHILIRNRTPVGKETIAGVQCNKYEFTAQLFGQTYRYTLCHDPVTNMFFYVEAVLDEAAWSRHTVTTWDTSVSGFGGIDLP